MDQRYDPTHVQLPESMNLLGLHKRTWGMSSDSMYDSRAAVRPKPKSSWVMTQKLHLCLIYRLLYTNHTDSSTLLAVFTVHTPLNKGLMNLLTFWASWVLWISWPELHELTSFTNFLSFQSFYCSQGGKFLIWERGKGLGLGVESKRGDQMPQWRFYEKMIG